MSDRSNREGPERAGPGGAEEGQGPVGKAAPGHRSLLWAKKPSFGRKGAQLLVFGFAAVAFVAIVVWAGSERKHAPAQAQKKNAPYASEVPRMLDVGPADYAAWGETAGARPVQPGLTGTGVVGQQAEGVYSSGTAYRTYSELPSGGSARFPNPNQPSALTGQYPPPQGAYPQGQTQGGMPFRVNAQSLEKERELAALRSPLFFPAGVPPSGARHPAQVAPSRESASGGANESKFVKQNMAKEKQEFLASQKGDYGAYLDNRYITAVDPAHELVAGTIIPITMVTGIDSDLPGTIIGEVNENVYDSITGENILIPAGSRLIGEYDNSIAFGQNRVLCAWNRLIEPDGVSIELRGMPGTDLEGKAGFQDKVDYHFTKLLEGVGLATVFDVATNAALSALSTASFLQSIASSMVVSGSASSTAGSETQQIVIQYATKLLNQQPTIVIRAGYRANVIVNKDMILPAYPDATIPYTYGSQ